MSNGMTVENLLSALPSVLKNDKNMEALATSIASVLSVEPEQIDAIAIYPGIENASEELCDILAKDFNVEWYRYDFQLDIKRNQIQTSFYIHKRLGTKGAISKALSDIYPGSSVYEWFEYGGNPYYFRIVIDVTDQLVELSHDEIVKAVNIYKSLRSKLEDDSIVYRSRLGIEVSVSCGWVCYDVPRCGTVPYNTKEGGITDSDLIIETAGIDGTAYSVRMCGTPVGSLI